MSADTFTTRWNYHLLTSPGYYLMMTNYTGSTGFGEKFADDIERDVLRGPALETLEAIAEAGKKYPQMDLTRQARPAALRRVSHELVQRHHQAVQGLVNHAGAVNNESQYGVNDGGLDRELRMGVPIWETGQGQWFDQSPIRYAKSWKTPMLVTQGELDFRVPISESMTTFKLLQRLKVPVAARRVPGRSHWILKGPEQPEAHGGGAGLAEEVPLDAREHANGRYPSPTYSPSRDHGLAVALTSTLYNFDIDLSDADRGVYESLSLRVARHPSESEDYLLTRVLAYALEFAPGIAFSQGLCVPDEPALWIGTDRRPSRWVDIGAPDAARLHRAAKASPRVVVYNHKDVAQWLGRLEGARIHRAAEIAVWAMDRTLLRDTDGAPGAQNELLHVRGRPRAVHLHWRRHADGDAHKARLG